MNYDKMSACAEKKGRFPKDDKKKMSIQCRHYFGSLQTARRQELGARGAKHEIHSLENINVDLIEKTTYPQHIR